MKTEKSRRLAAIMFTDIVGYTRLMQKDEQAAARLRARHREVFHKLHDRFNGQILQYFGDGTLSIFTSGVEAVECAISIQKKLQAGEKIPLRIGLHTGDIVFDGTEVFGDGVNTAARIESIAVAGAVLISGKLNDELNNQTHISTRSMGFFEFKNIENPVEIFAVSNDGIILPQPSELKGKTKGSDKTIAVLPFVNMSHDKGNEYFSDGMTEEIINALTRVKGLKVTSRTSSFYFKNKKLPLKQIGRELNVATILEGSVRLAGSKMRITAQLVDVEQDHHFWSETFDRSVENIFAVQDEISLLIADRLRDHLGHLEIDDRLIDQPPVTVEAYKSYLKGRYHILKMSPAEIETGLGILKKIIEEQPNYALAHLGVHLGYTLLGTLGYIPASEAFSIGKTYLDTAINLDPDLPECQLHQAWMRLLEHWDFKGTYHHLARVFEIRPVVDYYQTMASTLVAEGKIKAAMNYMGTAMQLDPFSPVNHHLKGFIYFTEENYSKAIKWFSKSLEIDPNAMISQLYLAQAYILSGQPERSFDLFDSMNKDSDDGFMKLGGITLSNAALGQKGLAEKGISKLESALNSDKMERAMNLLILCHTLLGNYDEVFSLLDRGLAIRLPLMIYLPVEPMLKPLRPDPRFREFTRQVLGEDHTIVIPERKYKKALFNKKELTENKARLEDLMDKQTPYLDPELTLRDLAKLLALPPNYVSQLLNEGFNKNFSEFINTYRLQSFKSLAADPANSHLTILALAYESGFSSKTVFNTFFKKVTGQTPKAWWKVTTGR